MAKLSLFNFLTSLFLALIIATGTGYPFYHHTDQDAAETADFSFNTEGKDSREEAFFVLYDNFKQVSAKRPGEPLIFPYTNNAVPADLIPCDMPLYALLRRGEVPGDPISEMLYANLKLKKLIEEYIRLREQSSELLAGLEVYADVNKTLIEVLKNIRIKSTYDIEKTISIYSRLEKLDREAGDTAGHHGQLLAVSDKEKDAAVLAKIRSLVSSQRFQSASEWMVHKDLSDETERKPGAAAPGSPDNREREQDTKARQKGKAAYAYDQDSLLSQILDLPGNILKYVVANKIKSAVFLAVSIFIIYILAMLIRSRFHN